MTSPILHDPDEPRDHRWITALAFPVILWRFAGNEWWPEGYATVAAATEAARRHGDDAAVVTGPPIPVEW